MNTAKAHGPAKSPTVLDTPMADSVNADAHCAIVASDAPEHTISTIIRPKMGVFSRLRMPMLLPSSINRSIGQLIKFNVLYNGTKAQMSVSIFQLPTPNIEKKRVEPNITPTAPQL